MAYWVGANQDQKQDGNAYDKDWEVDSNSAIIVSNQVEAGDALKVLKASANRRLITIKYKGLKQANKSGHGMGDTAMSFLLEPFGWPMKRPKDEYKNVKYFYNNGKIYRMGASSIGWVFTVLNDANNSADVQCDFLVKFLTKNLDAKINGFINDNLYGVGAMFGNASQNTEYNQLCKRDNYEIKLFKTYAMAASAFDDKLESFKCECNCQHKSNYDSRPLICFGIDIDHLSNVISSCKTESEGRKKASKVIENVGNTIDMYCKFINYKKFCQYQWEGFHQSGDEFSIHIGHEYKLKDWESYSQEQAKIFNPLLNLALNLIAIVEKEANISITVGIAGTQSLADEAESKCKENGYRGCLSVIGPTIRNITNFKEHCFIVEKESDIKDVLKAIQLGRKKQNQWPKGVKAFVVGKHHEILG